MLLISCGLASAQSGLGSSEVPPNKSGTDGPAPAPATGVDANSEYQTRTEELLRLQETQVKEATAKLDQIRPLVAEGLIAKVELEDGQQALANLQALLETGRKELAAYQQKIALIEAEAKLAKTQATTTPLKLAAKPLTRPILMRYNGTAGWSIGNLTGIQSFFYSEFGRSLPTSAVGQSATHNRLRYNHSNAVDVALHPDSAQGKILINYLQTQGIPFLAFRAAIPGVATGPHIHIGNPSHRI